MTSPWSDADVRRVDAAAISKDWLRDFVRRQMTEVVWRRTDHGFREETDCFSDDWTHDDHVRVLANLRHCAAAGGAVLCMGPSARIHGFAAVEPGRFGPRNEYVELTYLHVSAPVRCRGIGRKLFRAARSAARELGASRLYIGAHPARETQLFYQACGCVPARWIHPAILEREPKDLQLECSCD